MEIKSIEPASNVIRKLWEKHGIQEPMRFLGFCLSMLPIPVIQQTGQALEKHLSDESFRKEIDKIWKQIVAINEMASKVESLELAILEVDKAIKTNPNINTTVYEFIHNLVKYDKELKVIEVNGTHIAEGVGTVIGLDIQQQQSVKIMPGTISRAKGIGTVIATRIGGNDK